MPFLLALLSFVALLPLGIPGVFAWAVLVGALYLLLLPSSPKHIIGAVSVLATLALLLLLAVLGESVLPALLLLILIPLLHRVDAFFYMRSRKPLWIKNGPDEGEMIAHRVPFFIRQNSPEPNSLENFYRSYLGREKDWNVSKDNVREQTSFAYRFGKRLLEISISLALLLATLPIWIAMAVAIKISSPGPLLFWQTRTGLNGQDFQIAKFRSMHVLDREARWADDEKDRIFLVGSVIRRLHLDELPQLLSVLRGELSLVGPRPEQSALVPQVEKELPGYTCRHLVRPGLTGWAQVNYGYGGSMRGAADKLEYDMYYVKNQSLWLDIKTCLLTPRRILHGG